jgi:hypothetical protein
MGGKGHSNVVGVVVNIAWKVPIMFCNFVAILASSPLLLDSFVTFN